MRDGNQAADTPPTLPRGYTWWRERRGLLASGLRSPSRFTSGVVREDRPSRVVPVTVAVPHRYCTGFRASPFAYYDCWTGSNVGTGPPCRKSMLEPRLERRSLLAIPPPFLGRHLGLATTVSGVERGDRVEQAGRRAGVGSMGHAARRSRPRAAHQANRRQSQGERDAAHQSGEDAPGG